MSVILIGMPSSGKSTLGVLLAKNLGYSFIDSDIVIQEREGKLLHELIDERGTDGFLRAEESANLSITSDRAVIATGGSVVYCEKAMGHLRTLGKFVYLKIPYDEMCRRLGDFSHRGVIVREGSTLEDMYRERTSLYEKYADLTVDVSRADFADSVKRICKVLNFEE